MFITDKCCPLIRKRNNVRSSAEWITPEIKTASNDLKKLYWLNRKLNNVNSRENYKIAKRNYDDMLKKAKLNFNNRIISQSSNKQKTVWNLVNKELGRIKTEKSLVINVDNTIYKDPRDVADIFGQYFATIAESSLQNHFSGNHKLNVCTVSKINNRSFFFNHVTPDEVVEVITHLKNKSSVGFDNISIRVLKSVGSSIAKHLAYLINLSITTGKFPTSLKLATVIPILKKNNPEDIANYRPISILSVISKVIEKLVYKRIYEFLSKFNIISDSQHGFRKGKSTQSAATELFEFIYAQLDKGQKVAGIFFDLSRAFDSIRFDFIENKLYNLGIRGIILEWLKDYLRNRQIIVKVSNTFSKKNPVNLGVPQGSVLGPLIFILFINDLPQHIHANQISLFADDTSLAISASTLEELKYRCLELTKSFEKWCCQNGLILNTFKTEYIHFSLNNNETNLEIDFGGGKICSTNKTKFLGIHVDQHLQWKAQIESVVDKLNRARFAISRLRSSIPMESLLSIYYSLVYSHLSYNVILWGNSSQSDRVFIAQKRILRTMFGLLPKESCRNCFILHGLLTFPCIYIFRCLLYIKENLTKFKKNSFFHNHETRNKELINIPTHRTSKFELSPSYQGIRLYNCLPPSLKELNLGLFKIKIKKLLALKGYYAIEEFVNDPALNLFV